MANHLRHTSKRWDSRGDIPVMTVVVMLMGSALVAIATAAAALAGHAVVAQTKLKSEDQAQSLGKSVLSVFYSNLQADPNYFTTGGSFPGADGKWHTFGPNGAIEDCLNASGQESTRGIPTPAESGCWALQVQETNQGASAGGTLQTPSGKPISTHQQNQAATITAYAHVDCHGTLASCTSAEVVQHLSRKDFLDFLYFTTNQRVDPTFTGTDLCSGSGCTHSAYYSYDTIYGPIYAEGQIYVCGNPTFDGLVETMGGPPVYKVPTGSQCANTNPHFNGGTYPNAPQLQLPPSDSSLFNIAGQAGSPWTGQPSYDFNGNVTIDAVGSTLDITYGGIHHTGVAFPSNGVLYASGNISVQGTVAGQLTLAAGGDVYVTNSLNYACAQSGPVPTSCQDYTGLVAGGSIYVDDSGSSVTLDAAMLATNSSDGSISINPKDLTTCQGTCPTLHIYGSMAATYSGVFGAYDGSGVIGEGFAEAFHYDYRLFHNSPPWMLSSQTGGWNASAPVVVGAPTSNSPVIAEAQQPVTATPPPAATTTTTTTPSNHLATPAPACQSANEIGYGTAASTQTSFEIPICRTVPTGTPVLVGVSTFTSSPSTSVTDAAGNTYSLVASQPGVYLYGSVLKNALPAGSSITVDAIGQFGMSGIAEAVPGATLTTDQSAIGGYEVSSPISASYRTTTTEDDLLFLAAGGTEPATVTPSTMATDQVISGVSTVFSSREVSYGTHSLGMSWPDTGDARSWMAVALQMSGAQPASSTCPSSTDLGQGTVADNGQSETFSFPVCRSVAPNAPVLVGVYTASTSSFVGVVDSAGNAYHQVASQPGVYLYGTSNPNGLQPGDEVTVTATGNWGIDGIAEALPGVSLAVDQASQGAQLVTPPVNVSYNTTWSDDDVIFMAAGGSAQASISPSPAVNDQLVNGMSAVFSASEVPNGSGSLTANWSPSDSARSWMLVALVMQGATHALHASGVTPSPALPGWQVAITGTGFGSSQGSGYVHLADLTNGVNWGAPGNAATFTVNSWSDTQIVFTVPTPSGSYGEWRVNPGDNVQVDVHTASGQTSNKVSLGIAAPSCPSSTDIGQGTTPDNGAWTGFSFLTCRNISAGTPVLVAVYTASGSAAPTVADTTGDPYSLIAWQPGVYLFGTNNPNGIFADEVIAVQAQGDWGLDAIAEVVPNVTLSLDTPSQGGYLVGSPVNVSYGTSMTNDALLFLAAGGTAQASVSMPNMAIDDQIVTGMSGVFASGEVSYGEHSLSMSWPDTGDARSWMVVALRMQGDTDPPPTSFTIAPSAPSSSCMQQWTVPAGVYSVDASLLGGSGGQGESSYGGTYSDGGPAGTVSGAVSVTPGEVLDLYTGEYGGYSTYGGGGCGYTDGGAGGSYQGSYAASGGGGSSAIVDAATGQPLLVAGGGGGASEYTAFYQYPDSTSVQDIYDSAPENTGGNGGNPLATAGGGVGLPPSYGGSSGGGAATQSSPGAGGYQGGLGGSAAYYACEYQYDPSSCATYFIDSGGEGSSPNSGNGGVGANAYYQFFYEEPYSIQTTDSAGGGGGGGYYGGGGGGAYLQCTNSDDCSAGEGPGGGGGGSSWADPSLTQGVSYGVGPTPPQNAAWGTTNYAGINGSVSITYVP